MERVTPDWAGNYWYVLLCFIGALTIGYVILKVGGSGKPKRWLSYIAVLLGGISIISISMQSHEKIAQIEHRALKWKLKSDADQIRDSINGTLHVLCGIERVKSEFSPPDFDQILQSQKSGCDIMKSISDYSTGTLSGDEKLFETPALGQSGLYSDTVKIHFEQLDRLVGSYNHTVALRRSYADGDGTLVEIIKAFTLLFEPFLAAIALAFGLLIVRFSKD